MSLTTRGLSFKPAQAIDLPGQLTLVFMVSKRTTGDEIPPEDARLVTSSRHCLGSWLQLGRFHHHLIEDAQLLLTELVTNAIEHGRTGEVEIRVISSRDSVTLSVRDGSEAVRRPQVPDVRAEEGRGLFIVDAITSERGGSWGESLDNTTTWCSLPSQALIKTPSVLSQPHAYAPP